ncbi:MAG: GNAT family N-acetyltransferase [Sphaerochaeta sp.]
MDFRLAVMDDLPQLKSVYDKIIEAMNMSGIQIWDDVYPCEFFRADIENECLYVLVEDNEIASAFGLCNTNAGEAAVVWETPQATAVYLDRFGVNVNFLRKGIGSLMLTKARALARELGAAYVRLFVVDVNEPAINLYRKNGFDKVEGFYDEIVAPNQISHEFGFEIKTPT